MICANCGAENREGRRFCSKCGSGLSVNCTSCGFANELDDVFCGGCGASLTPPTPQEIDKPSPPEIRPIQPEPKSASGERRQVTALFADLAGFTTLSNQLDAEEIHGYLNHFFEAVDGVVEDYGGYVDKHIGDCVMAVFGAPVAHGNDPERAVRAALEIQQSMPRLSRELGRQIAVHIGIASGEVVASGTGSASRQEYTVTGDSVNLASRLSDMAKAGETLISGAVHDAVGRIADCSAVGNVSVKGFDKPIDVWRVTSLGASSEQQDRRPLIGRKTELRQFAGVLDACQEDHFGQVTYVRGEAGFGKTRLVQEFREIAEHKGFVCHTGLVLDFGVGKGQDAIREIVRKLLGLTTHSSEDQRVAAAKQAVADDVLQADQLVYLHDLLDIPQPSAFRVLYDAMENEMRNQGKRGVVVGLLKAETQRGPVLLTVEDVHWADTALLAHFAEIAKAIVDCPVILLMTSRVESDPITEDWRNATRTVPFMTIDLAPLRAEEAFQFASGYMEATSHFARACIERAEGNPLFLEQLLRSAEETSEDSVPSSVQSLVLARIDKLDPADKEAVQAASVIGQRFSLDALRHLVQSPPFTCAALVEMHLVRPEGEDYLFDHALIREGVYSFLLKSRRRELHLRAAEWFAPTDPVLKAEHLDRAEDPQAARAYLDAAEAQAQRYRADRALALAERGLKLATKRGDEFALTCFKGQMLHDLGAIADSISTFERALELAETDGDMCGAWIGVAAGMRVADRYEGALHALDQAETIASRLGSPLELSKIHYYRGNIYFPLGNIEGCISEQQRALAYARNADAPECEARALSGLADASYSRGRMATALQYFRDCIELCRQNGFGRIEAGNRYMVAWTQLYQNQIQQALEEALGACEAANLIGHHRAEIIARLTAGRVLYEVGKPFEAKAQLEKGMELARTIGATRFEPFLMIYLGRIRRDEDGGGDDALRMMTGALELSRKTGLSFLGPWVLSTLALVCDNPQDRVEALREGEELLNGDCVGHNPLEFYCDAIEVSLHERDWDNADRYAARLEDYTRPEPLPWTDFFIARGRVLARVGRGENGGETVSGLKRLADQARAIGLSSAIPALDTALSKLNGWN